MWKYIVFAFLGIPGFVSADVVINEIAWMGTSNSATDEWIELYNNGSGSVDLAGWRISAEDGSPDILINDACVVTSIAAGGYFLLERTNDDSVPNTAADCVYTGSLGNSGEYLELADVDGNTADYLNARDGWSAGSNATKETMQKSGGGWITAPATPRAGNGSPSLPTASENPGSSKKEPAGVSGGGDTAYIPPERLPRITASAGDDMRAVVGEELLFRAEAWGTENEPLDTARYVWNFGDGSTREGRNTGYAYRYPGSYIVRLTVSSGKYAAFDDMRVTVGKNKLSVSEVLPGKNGWIEFYNAGSEQIHIGNWIMETAGTAFIVPLKTIVAPKSFAVLSAEITGLIPKRTGDHVYLFYPNGTYAAGISYIFTVPAGKSISDNDGAVLFTKSTPGEPNKIENRAPVPPQALSAPVPAKKQAVSAVSISASETARPASALSEDAPPTREKAPEITPSARAAAADAVPFSKKYKESLWFAASLVAGGLLAVGVVLFRRSRTTL